MLLSDYSLAIGGAEKSIRVVNLSEPQLKTMQTFNQKVSGKVMSLSWHPSKDGWLAYGKVLLQKVVTSSFSPIMEILYSLKCFQVPLMDALVSNILVLSSHPYSFDHFLRRASMQWNGLLPLLQSKVALIQ